MVNASHRLQDVWMANAIRIKEKPARFAQRTALASEADVVLRIQTMPIFEGAYPNPQKRVRLFAVMKSIVTGNAVHRLIAV